MPGINPQNVQILQRQIYPQFLERVGSTLQLTRQQLEVAAQIGPQAWAQWSMSVFGGDETIVFPSTEGIDVRSFGDGIPLIAAESVENNTPVLDYRKGELAGRVDALFAGKGPGPARRFEKISKTAAEFVFAVGSVVGHNSPEWAQMMPLFPQTVIGPNSAGVPSVRFPAQPTEQYPIEGSIASTVSFGPGVTGHIFAAAGMGLTKKTTLVSGGKSAAFVNAWNDQGLQAAANGIAQMRAEGTASSRSRLPGGVRLEDLYLPEVRYTSDGIAASIGGLSVGIDVMVMSAAHSAGPAECLAGVDGASALLRPGGLLVVKAPNVSLGNEAGMDIVAPHAANLFGAPVASGPGGKFEQRIDRSLPLVREGTYAIYQR